MIVLDTHIWIWWINGNVSELGIERQYRIEESESVGVSAISCFEVAWLQNHGRIGLSCSICDWFSEALEGSNVLLLGLSPEIAQIAVDLPEHHSDPQDRIIIATALKHDADIMSSDRKFPLYDEINERIV